jgi:predicted component of type VI protein secretion system
MDRRLVGPRTSVDDIKNLEFLTLSGIELQPLSHPAHSQSLY